MPGLLEDLHDKLAAIEAQLAGVADMLRAQARPVAPLTADEELVADGLMTVKDAAKHCSLSRTTIYEALNGGDLASLRVNSCRLIPRRGLLRWMASRVEHAHAEVSRG